MVELEDYKGQKPAWCPGCGNYSLIDTLKRTLVELEIPPHRLVVVSGIGQAAKLPHYLRCNTFNGLHGRALPVSTGVSMVNPEMLVLVTTGDGDCYGEGGNHLLHAIRRNINVKLFVHDNQVYGLTKGQASPTTMEGVKTKTQPFGVFSSQLNPLTLAIALDCAFVARGFTGDRPLLQALMAAAIRHKGFALIDILQPCITFNKVNTYKWYKERVYPLEADYDATDRMTAFQRSLEWGERIPTGIFYQHEKPVLTDMLPPLQPGPLPTQPFDRQAAKGVLREFY
ncbi:MAG: 2-oxoacid:ferredoxin oxidoreductase subunit beta [Deltaproteobacteria bacterium]|nr:2-oxoacid:ferredoxin oxidoreductase subunit beta [Deltaproteobacteria bacterium]